MPCSRQSVGHGPPVLGRRHDHTADRQHRLADERRDALGAEPRDRLLELAQAVVEGILAAVELLAVGVRRRQVVEAARQLADADLEPRETARRERAVRHAVVGVREREDERALGLAALVVVETRHLDRALAALRAAVREEDLVDPVRRELDQPVCELGGALVAEVPEHRRVLELRHLRRRNLCDLGPAVADLAQLDAAERVEVLTTLRVEVARPLAANEQERGPGEAPRVNHVLAVPRRELLVRNGHRPYRRSSGIERLMPTSVSSASSQPARTEANSCSPSSNASS